MSENKLKEKCGVFGYYGKGKASEKVFLGLHNIQHRGQESCGICSFDREAYKIHRGNGIVNDVFDNQILDTLNGYMAIGHVRYSTTGKGGIENAQPILEGGIAIAHNGQIKNYSEIKQIFRDEEFKTSSDTEIFLKLLNSKKGDLEERIGEAVRVVAPSYAMVILGQGKLIGLRDSAGVRPLEIARTKSKTGYVLSSETVGFDIIGAEHIRKVRPGEMVVIDDSGIQSHQLINGHPEQSCIFELIYFSRPDSIFSPGVSVGDVRREFGRTLYRENPVEADVVIEVPDSSLDAAMGVSLESGIRYDKGLIRSHYIGRTFIEPSQELRDAAVLKKFNVYSSVVCDKKVILVDDSIVRGTTLKDLIKFIREKGAKEVHVRISSPPYLNSCHLGIDTADESKIIAKSKSIEEICEFIEADSLYYLSKQGMLDNLFLKNHGFCTECFD